MTRSKKITLLERGMRAEAAGEWEEWLSTLSPKARRKYARQRFRSKKRMFARVTQFIGIMAKMTREVCAEALRSGQLIVEFRNAFDKKHYESQEKEP